MNQTDVKDRYSIPAQWLHWLIAGLILSQYVLAELAERADDAGLKLRELAILANHKSVGITILALAALRLGWRLIATAPPAPAGMAAWQRIASKTTHWGMYALLFAIPLSGWLMSSASAYSVSWFKLFTLPDFVGPSERLEDAMHDTHELLVQLLFVIVVVHVLAALKHHFFDKDNVLKRMTSPIGIALFAVSAIGTSFALSESQLQASGGGARGQSPDGAAVAEQTVAAETGAPAWSIDYDDSYVEFTGEQAGAPFTGRWQQWSAEIRFDPAALETSRFDVVIRTDSADTRDSERDETLADREWFASDRYPTARFVATSFAEDGADGYAAAATLTIKERPSPVEFRFTIEADGPGRVLLGTARLDRLALGVGTGDWEDTEWVGQYVDVAVRVAARVGD